MSKGAMNFNEDKVEYYTPKGVLDYLRLQGYNLEYDPATTPERAQYHGIPYFTALPEDGLKADWSIYRGIWINPPFNQKKAFWERALYIYRKTNADIFFLCPANFLPTKAFTKAKQPVSIWIPEGRIGFELTPEGGGATQSPAFGAVIVKPDSTPTVNYIPEKYLR